MKIVIATDSFKGSQSSIGAAALIEAGASAVFPDAEFLKIPIADGGEGTVEALVEGLGGERTSVRVQDPLGRSVEAVYGVVEGRAVIEMAAASGLPLLADEERDPRTASTYGTGEVILAAMEAGCRDITMGLGGSATNDGGTGMAAALGYRFLDKNGVDLPPGGAGLADLARIDDSAVNPLVGETAFHVACDVNNPLLGEQGASHIYGPQKGAAPDTVIELDAALRRLADVAEDWKGIPLRDVPGTGAAGGMGFGLAAFCDARMKSGIETILDLVDFDEKLAGASLVITGEGRIDGQSVRGKVPIGVAGRARGKNLPVLAIVGGIGPEVSKIYAYGIDSVMSCLDRPMLLPEAISRSRECIEDAAGRACRMIRIGMKIRG